MNLSKTSGKRPDVDEYFLTMAILASKRATCIRRRVGCIITDTNNNVLATGYNGVYRGAEHCLDNPCPGAYSASGKDLDKCYAIHAEQNALLQCKDLNQALTCYSTTAPCVTCTKLLLNTQIMRIVVFESYAHSGTSKILWESKHGKWIHLETYHLHEVDYALNRAFISTDEQLDSSKYSTKPVRYQDIGVGYRDQRSESSEYGPWNPERRRICDWHFRGNRRL